MKTKSSVHTEWALETFGVSRNIPITFGGLWISPSMNNRRCTSALSSELTSRIFSGCFYFYHTDHCHLFKFYLSFSLQSPRELMILQKNVRWKARVKAIHKTLLPFSSTFCHSLYSPIYLLSFIRALSLQVQCCKMKSVGYLANYMRNWRIWSSDPSWLQSLGTSLEYLCSYPWNSNLYGLQ